MKTYPRITAALLLLFIVGLCVAGTKVSRLVRTQTISSNDLFIVVTGTTTKVTRHLQAHDLARGLGPWITNSAAGGSATNAQPPSTILTNLSQTGAITNINEGNVLYVRTNGNDATAVRGRLDKPFLTVTGANAAAIAGDLVQFGSGHFDVGTNEIHFKHGVKYRGSGPSVTTIEGRRTNGFIQFITGESSIQDFKLVSRPEAAFFGLMIGGDYGDHDTMLGTNFFARNVHFDGETDCIYWQGLDDPKTRRLQFDHCKFTSGFDLVYAAGGSTNTSFRFNYCDFEADFTSRTNTANTARLAKWITVGAGGPAANMVFEHCTYRVINALYSYILEANDGSPFDPSYYHFTFLNCAVQQSVTNGGLAVGTIFTSQSGTNVSAVFNNVTPVTFNTNAPIFTNALWPSIVNLTAASRRTNWLPPITFAGRTNMHGLEIEIRDNYGNAGTSNITIAAQFGATIDGASTAVIDRDYGSIRLRTQGTNWTVVDASLRNTLSLSGDLNVGGNATLATAALSGNLTVSGNAAFDTVSFNDEATFTSDKIFKGVFGNSVLLGLNPDGYETNITLGANLSLAGDMTLSATGGGGGTPGGNSGAIQFAEGSALAGTNRLVYDRTNDHLRVLVDGFADGIVVTNSGNTFAVRLNYQGLIKEGGANPLSFGVAGNTNWQMTTSGHWVPTANITYDVGSTANQVANTYSSNAFLNNASIVDTSKRQWVHLGNPTNVVLNWSVTNYWIVSPSNVFTVSWINAPAAGSPAQSMFLELRNTNSTAGYFPTNGLNNASVIMLSAPSTNTYVFNFDGTNFWTDSGQILTTGLGDTNVFNVNPTIHDATLVGPVLTNMPQTNRVVFINAQGRLTNVTSASPSTDYVRADGSIGSPTAEANEFTKRTWQSSVSSGVSLSTLGELVASSSTGVIGFPATTTNTIGITYNTAATSDSVAIINQNSESIVSNRAYSVVFRVAMTNLTSVIGAFGSVGVTAGVQENPTSTVRPRIWAYYNSAFSPNWLLLTSTSGGGNYNTNDTGYVVNTEPHTVRIDVDPVAPLATFYLDGTNVSSTALKIPAQSMKWMAGVATKAAATNGFRFFQIYGEQTF